MFLVITKSPSRRLRVALTLALAVMLAAALAAVATGQMRAPDARTPNAAGVPTSADAGTPALIPAVTAPSAAQRARYRRWYRAMGRYGLRRGPSVVATASARRLRTETARMRRDVRRFERSGAYRAWREEQRYRTIPAAAKRALRAIARCESSGRRGAVSSSGTYRGLFQFDQGTWESVGGSGDPAAASTHEQFWRAYLLLRRSGRGPWPVCGR